MPTQLRYPRSDSTVTEPRCGAQTCLGKNNETAENVNAITFSSFHMFTNTVNLCTSDEFTRSTADGSDFMNSWTAQSWLQYKQIIIRVAMEIWITGWLFHETDFCFTDSQLIIPSTVFLYFLPAWGFFYIFFLVWFSISGPRKDCSAKCENDSVNWLWVLCIDTRSGHSGLLSRAQWGETVNYETSKKYSYIYTFSYFIFFSPYSSNNICFLFFGWTLEALLSLFSNIQIYIISVY